MKKIKLTQAKYALVDDADYEWLNQWKWQCVKTTSTMYAAFVKKYKRRNKRTSRMIFMHRIILDIDGKSGRIKSDHRDGDGLNNRRNNLRIATNSQNQQNKRCFAKGGVKGVYRRADLKLRPFQAKILVKNKRLHLGYFATAQQAGNAYDRAALRYFGEFARLNGRK